MARKSKDAILCERLLSVSKCPFDIFDVMGEECLPIIERCEAGDVPSLESICSELCASLPDGATAEAVVYLLGKGVALGSRRCAELAIRYIAVRKLIPELARASLKLLGEGEPTDEMRRVIAMLAIHESEGYSARLALLPEENYAAVWLFVLRREGALTDEMASRLSALAGVPRLPAMLYKEDLPCSSKPELARFCELLFEYPDDGWRDFWLILTYEYACAAGDIVQIGRMLFEAFGEEFWEPIYSLAAARLLQETDEAFAVIAEELDVLCRFCGLDTEGLDCEAVIREGVYASSGRKRELYEQEKRLGGIIEHVKNRYRLTHTLTERGKRARMHHWETTVSIEAEELPCFNAIKIEEIRYAPYRHGATLTHDPASCQVICRSEIIFNERRHPFELDLLIDLPYVSATKCQSVEIRPRMVEKNDGYLTMRCDFYLH